MAGPADGAGLVSAENEVDGHVEPRDVTAEVAVSTGKPGPPAVVAMRTSRDPDARGLKADNPFGVYADGIALSEVALPDGWQGRVNTEQIDDGSDVVHPVTLVFPEIHDLCAPKLPVAVTGGFGRRSDREFVSALAEAGLVDLELLHDRIRRLPATVAAEVRDATHAIVDALGQGGP